MLEHALKYASYGWNVFPVHSIINGKCTCTDLNCEKQGKHPVHAGGFKNATKDPEIIRATGSISDLLVVDIDISLKKDGFASLKILEHQFGKLPHSLRVRTGSGGVHIYLQMPEHSVKCSVERLGKGLDVRADGGYVIAPPSVHISGKAYEWETPNE
jgi:hypothetical protein